MLLIIFRSADLPVVRLHGLCAIGVVLLGEDILVLETSTKEQAQDAKITWVTLAVTPQSVSDLLSAAAKGAIHLVLPGKDEAPQTNEGANNG